MLLSVILLGQQGSPVVDPIVTTITGYGALGVVLLMLVTGQLYTKAHVGALNARITDQDEQLKAMRKRDDEITIPTLARVADVLPLVTDGLRKQEERNERVAGQLDRIERNVSGGGRA